METFWNVMIPVSVMLLIVGAGLVRQLHKAVNEGPEL